MDRQNNPFDMNLWGIWISEIPYHEYIALITIAVGIPALVDCNSIDAFDGRMLYDNHIVEQDLDIAVALESTSQIIQILLLGLNSIFHLLA